MNVFFHGFAFCVIGIPQDPCDYCLKLFNLSFFILNCYRNYRFFGWQRGQKKVERPAWTILLMGFPQRRQDSPSRP
jgi:hypothetical protein